MIRLNDVAYTYAGYRKETILALNDVSLQGDLGEVLGIAGANGAGKTTLISLLLGYITPTFGTVTIDGRAPRAFVEREGIGYVSELMAMPSAWTTVSALQRFASLTDIPSAEQSTVVNDALDRFDLARHERAQLKALSKGTAQRVGLAQSLLRDYRLIIFDEPTHGLDPEWMLRFRDLVSSLRGPSRLIIIASHNLDELERLADRVMIMNRGVVGRVVTTRSGAVSGASARYRLAIACVSFDMVLHAFPNAVQIGLHEFEFMAAGPQAVTMGIKTLMELGGELHAVSPIQSTLERHFSEVVGARAT